MSKTVCTLENISASELDELLPTLSEPCVIRGLVSEWPVTQAAQHSADALATYLHQFDANQPVTLYQGQDEGGRIFYNTQMDGFNFTPVQLSFSEFMNRLLSCRWFSDKALYLGSTLLDHWLPGFRQHNDLALTTPSQFISPLVSMWLGNQTTVAAHFDFPQNLACCVAGKRRFTLFPPEQLVNLYVGPLDFNPAGQAISLVNPDKPDFDQFPRYRDALQQARIVELMPGDVLFIPSMWWHQVQSLEPVNMLINYWWRDTPAYLGAPMNVLLHALMSLKALPQAQRDAWKGLLEYYVFNEETRLVEHIPEHKKGILADTSESLARRLRAELLNKLNR